VCSLVGEKLLGTEVDVLVQGMEDSNGMINYEGIILLKFISKS